MRPFSSCLLIAAVVFLVLPPQGAAAFDRGLHGSHGFGRPGNSGDLHHSGRRPFFHRPHSHFHRHHGRRFFGYGYPRLHHRGPVTGFYRVDRYWPFYGYPSQTVVIENNAQASAYAGAPSEAELPATTGIRTEPAGSPVIYVINAARPAARPLMRKGAFEQPGPKIVSVHPLGTQRDDNDAVAPGPQVVHVAVRRGR